MSAEYVYLVCHTCGAKNRHINIDIPEGEYFCNNTCEWRKRQQEILEREKNKETDSEPEVTMLSETSGRTGCGYIDDYF
jgi:hypothetical protein